MLNENGLTFKDFEKKTFEMICKLGQKATTSILCKTEIKMHIVIKAKEQQL